jgi:hypothetical protein
VIPAALTAPVATLAAVVTQAQPPAPGSDRGEEFGKTSPIALVVILLLAIATVVLIRSMSKRLRNVPASFDPPKEAPPASDSSGAPDPSGAPGPSGAVGPSGGPAPDRGSPDG